MVLEKKLFVTLIFTVMHIFAQTWVPAGTRASGGETQLIDYKIVWEDTREKVDSGTLRYQVPRGMVTILDDWVCGRLGFAYNLRTGLTNPKKVGNRNQILMFLGFRKATLVDRVFGR